MPEFTPPDAEHMTSTKPYLVRAFYEWIVDNDCTPYIVVDAEHEAVEVPRNYVEDGRIILNISPLAVKNLFIDNAAVTFNARFSGRIVTIYTPISAVQAIYARENGRGMVFGEEEDEGGEPPPAAKVDADGNSAKPGSKDKGKKGSKPQLRVVK